MKLLLILMTLVLGACSTLSEDKEVIHINSASADIYDKRTDIQCNNFAKYIQGIALLRSIGVPLEQALQSKDLQFKSMVYEIYSHDASVSPSSENRDAYNRCRLETYEVFIHWYVKKDMIVD